MLGSKRPLLTMEGLSPANMSIQVSVKSEGPILNCFAFIKSKSGDNTKTMHFWLPVTVSLTDV